MKYRIHPLRAAPSAACLSLFLVLTTSCFHSIEWTEVYRNSATKKPDRTIIVKQGHGFLEFPENAYVSAFAAVTDNGRAGRGEIFTFAKGHVRMVVGAALFEWDAEEDRVAVLLCDKLLTPAYIVGGYDWATGRIGRTLSPCEAQELMLRRPSRSRVSIPKHLQDPLAIMCSQEVEEAYRRSGSRDSGAQ